MKKGIFIFIFLFFLFTFQIFAADLSGTWQGPGEVTFSFGKKMPCSKITIRINHGPHQLMVSSYQARCGLLQPDWGPRPFDLADGKVYEDGEQIGTFDGHLFKTLATATGVQYAFNFKVNDDQNGNPETLQTYYGTRNLSGAVVVEGVLKRVGVK
ncbi:MAG: hypothetical protein WCG27_02950 [Pseudomonadota bacterium]